MINNVVNDSRITSALGVEIDNRFSDVADTLWSKYGLKTINSDFTDLTPPKNNSDLFNLIITNPPYVRHHHLKKEKKEEMKLKIKSTMRYTVNGLMGLYGYFIFFSHRWMADDAIGVWLIPTEFMDVNYGKIIKKYLTNEVTLLQIHRFDPNEIQFNDALVTSAVVIFKKKIPENDHNVLFTYGGSISHPSEKWYVTLSQLTRHKKWTHINSTIDFKYISKEDNIRLGDYFSIKRGIATGDNKFFIFNKKQAIQNGIDEKFLIPILPSPRLLKRNVIESDEFGVPNIDEPLFLLNCDVPITRLKDEHRDLYDYLSRGMENGVTDRYLVKKRNPWYRQENRNPAPFLCTYMGRKNKSNTPFRFIWNKSKAIATNVYLLLYPKNSIKMDMCENEEWHKEIFQYLSNINMDDLVRNGRTYGGGLHKIEPKELSNVIIDDLFKNIEGHKIKIQRQQSLALWTS